MSVGRPRIERMSESDGSVAMLGRMRSAARGEACQAATRLDAIGDLMALRMVQDGGASDNWVFDVVDAVAVEIAAAMRISRGLAASYIRYADAMRNHLPPDRGGVSGRRHRRGHLPHGGVPDRIDRR
jgi:hypothetical protein